jgi:isoprenylcysteine carboxyl methyltransferase (ICMT) family protein YpbQ
VSTSLIIIFVVAAFTRLCSAAVSRLNEQRLRALGAREHGALVSKLVISAHTLFYLAAFAEGWLRETVFDTVSAIGLAVLIFAFAVLVWVVRILGRIWTLKIMIADDHPVSRHPLFRYFRHPNYLLNVLPELVGYAMVFHAWHTLAFGLPLYLALLAVRIVQEERAMKPLLSGMARG